MARRRPGFAEGFVSTFGPTAQQATMATIRELLSAPSAEEQELNIRAKRAQVAALEAKPPGDETRVTLTTEIINGLPTLKGLGLEGKSVTANSLLDIRRVGKTIDPLDQFKALFDFTTGSRGIDLQTRNPEIFGALIKKLNVLAPEVIPGLELQKKPALPKRPVKKLTADEAAKEFGF